MNDIPKTIRLYGTATDSIVDGPGLRYSVFTQGCQHGCPGCHNPESQALDGGYEANIDEIFEEIVGNKIIQGVTLSGGEPLLQSEACLALAHRLKEKGFNIWIYSGYLFEDVMAGSRGAAACELLGLCDVLVDGPFIEARHDYELKWCGSSNQRVIDLPKSHEAKAVVLWQNRECFPEVPPSW